MGLFSGIHRYREAGEPTDIDNLEEFGEPAYSLFTSTPVLSLTHEIDITDAQGNLKYHSESKMLSLHDKTYLTDASGREVAYIHSKAFSLHEWHYVDMADGLSFELSTELFHLIEDVINIEGLAWQMRGDILALDFQLFDQNGQIVATISQKMLSLHDKYCIDIYQPDYEKVAVAILVTLQHMIRDREDAQSADTSSN